MTTRKTQVWTLHAGDVWVIPWQHGDSSGAISRTVVRLALLDNGEALVVYLDGRGREDSVFIAKDAWIEVKNVPPPDAILAGLALLAMLWLGGCQMAKAGHTPRAETVFIDQAGYRCFLVRDEDGKAVGGNCVRED